MGWLGGLAALAACCGGPAAGWRGAPEAGASLFRAAARCPLRAPATGPSSTGCQDEIVGCAALGDRLFDGGGRCMSPVDELCLASCGMCGELREYSACRSPASRGGGGGGVAPATGDGLPGPRSGWGARGPAAIALERPGGLRGLFEGMAARHNRTLTSQRPLLLELDGFLDEEQAATLVGLADRTVRPEWEDDGLPPWVRNVSKMDCEHPSCKLNGVVLAMYRKVEALVQLPASNFESLELLRYEPGNHYETHLDNSPEDTMHLAGPRLLTAFVYLTDAPAGAGGATIFPRAQPRELRVVPRRGKLVIWANMADKAPWHEDAAAEHVAERVLAGVKYGFNLWIHPRNYRLPSLAPHCF